MSAPINNLPEWLNAATENLSASAKERIKLEIESHFEQAVESHCEQGLTESESQTCALTELGDAKAAAKIFRKNYLTEAEVKLVEAELKRNRSVWMQCLNLGGYLLIFGLFYLAKRPHSPLPLLLAGALLIMASTIQTSCLWVARYPISRSRVRLLFTFQMLEWFIVMMSYGFVMEWGWSVSMFIAVMSLSLGRRGTFRLWFKIHRGADLGQETRPPSATVS